MSKHSPASAVSDGQDVWSDESGNEDGDAGSSRKRRRTATEKPISVSCETCKSRKVKCDRARPSCGWCLKNNQLCEYKERKKPGLRAGYGKELEGRMAEQAAAIEELRQIIARHEIVIAQLTNDQERSPHASGSHSENPLFRTPSLPTTHVPRPETALFMQRPSHSPYMSAFSNLNDRRTPSLPHSAGFQGQVGSENMASSGIQGVQAVTKDIFNEPNPAMQSPTLDLPEHSGTTPNSVPATASHEFPDHDLCYHLVDLFFKHINVWCPILHRRSTMDLLFGPMPLQEEEKVLLHAIIATTLRFSSDRRLNDSFRQSQHKISKERVQLFGMEHSSVRALQALVILTLDLVGDSNGPPGWNMLALIARQVVQLGLSVESTSLSIAPIYPSIYTLRAMILPEPRDFIEEETRRRLFWVIYLLDRYATIATAFEFALDEKEIDRRLPCREDLLNNNQHVQTRWFKSSGRVEISEDKPENLGAYSYYIEVVGILSKIHQFLKEPVDIGALADVERWQKRYRELDSELQSWKYRLPHEYGDMSRIYDRGPKQKAVNCSWVMLHAAYHTTIIRLHSSAAYPTTRSPIFTPSYSAAQRCQAAVENIVALSTYVKTADILNQFGPPFAFSLWVAARVLLVHGCTIDHRVSQSINPLVETLREMGSYWKVADRYATLLQRVLDEYRESERAPGMETPNTVKILADMRRTAFDLDSLISRAPKIHNTGNVKVIATPARTPAPSDLEYLDVFDFFNLPRLPTNPGTVAETNGGREDDAPTNAQNGSNMHEHSVNGLNEFNITNFIFDQNTDWLGS
ncbi:uncharacterized protein PV09_06338 [Verruconis gallopava]|uniref:Zn(2)-C6 fungal-type domain-containing protein n=1 Tax=Verruconis gallopava TaxID=253628 RepID=A0A0D2ASN4_9PEZI|nr:uncharacterized protein PV09_06338 [Verruconis gallopava]KIW02174.1 hypothetical protein PV09_06338 [Verruconis gallopava]